MTDPESGYAPAVALPLLGAVPVSGDVQIGMRVLEGPNGDHVIHLGLDRRIGDGAFCPTAAGFRVPLHLVPLLIDELQRVAQRASERAVWAPPTAERDRG